MLLSEHLSDYTHYEDTLARCRAHKKGFAMNSLSHVLGWTKKAMKNHHTLRTINIELAVFACLLMVATTSFYAPATPTKAANVAVTTSTITNFDASGHQITRYDTNGNAVDAHDGMIALFGSTYYLYGTSYNCGFTWLAAGAPFCGFKVYTSTDLVHWTDKGLLFDATTSTWQARCNGSTYGCFRPHVIYNGSTGRYVLWINSYDNASGYHVFTSGSPLGPFVEGAEPTLAVQGTGKGVNNGDFGLFVDSNGTAYIVHTDVANQANLYVEQLNASYTSGTGNNVRVGQSGVESPDIFKYKNTYYLVYGPSCPYCNNAKTEYSTSTSLPGTWSAPTTLNNNSCAGQASFVALLPTTAGTTYMYASDLWNNGAHNEALANYFWTPLTFNSDGSIQPFSCTSSFQISLTTGAPGSQNPISGLDQSSGVNGFTSFCDIGNNVERLQTFTPSQSGTLTSVAMTTFQAGSPNANLAIDIVSVNAQGQPTGTLSTHSIAASSIGWSPRNVIISPNIAVTAGQHYGIQLHSATTQGCYGMNYNDANLYNRGQELYSNTTGSSFAVEANRVLKFYTTLTTSNPNYASGAAATASSSYEGSGWGLAHINDGQRTSTTASMGWSSTNTTGSNHTEWVQLNLGSTVPVNRIDLYPRSDAGNVGQGFPINFTLAISTDNVTWTTVVTQTGYPLPGTGAVQSFTFSAQNARYIRVQGTVLRPIPNENNFYRMQFAEIEVY